VRTVTRTTVLAVILLFAAAGLAWDAGASRPTPAADATEAVRLDPPTTGAAYCPSLAGDDEDVVVTVTPAAPAGEGGASRVRIEAGAEVAEELEVTPDGPAAVTLTGTAASRPVTVTWTGAPVVATVTTRGDRPVALQCEASTAPRWHLAGFTTTLGNDATLHLFNPFSVDAVATVRYATNDGPVELVSTRDVAVAAGESITVDLDEVQPEVRDLGVIVDVQSGRLVAAGEMRFAPPDEESNAVTGRTAIPAVAEPAGEHVFPYGALARDSAFSWVQVMNPGEDEAIVLATASAPDPEVAEPEEVHVPPGATVRLDLRGLSSRYTFATEVTVANDTEVVATRVATRRGEDATSADAATAAPPATEWILAGAGTRDRAGAVDVYNPGSAPATVTLSPLGLDAPAEWRDVVIEPNGQRGLPLDALGEAVDEVSLRLSADAPVSAGIRSARQDRAPQRFWTLPGFTEEAWSGLATRPTTTHDPDLDREPLPTTSASPPPS
jgi:Family of unknown function (DUF5719)